MTHRFKKTCYNTEELLSGVDTLSKFMRQVEAQCTQYPHRFSPEVYKGDAFEAFIEVLIKASPIDPRINIVQYQPIKRSGDWGVDGAGLCHDLVTPHTVQAKYRSNAASVLTANEDHISNFVAHSTTSRKYRGVNGEQPRMTLFTTAKELHRKVRDHMYEKNVRVIGYRDLKAFVDHNDAFWTRFRKEIGFKG